MKYDKLIPICCILAGAINIYQAITESSHFLLVFVVSVLLVLYAIGDIINSYLSEIDDEVDEEMYGYQEPLIKDDNEQGN